MVVATATKQAGAPLEVAVYLACRKAGVGGEAIGARAVPEVGVAVERRAWVGGDATVQGVEEANVRGPARGPAGVPVAAKDAHLRAKVAGAAPARVGGRVARRA